MPLDVFKRFTSTPLEHSFGLPDAVVSVATNSKVLADRLLGALPVSVRNLADPPAFAWRVVVESDDDLDVDLESLCSHHLSQNGLSIVTIGQKGFLACDIRAQKGVSFVSERFVNSETLFQRYFLPALVSLPKECHKVIS